MATKEQFNTTIEEINHKIDEILQYTTEDLIQEKALGTSLSFKEIEYVFDQIFDLSKRAKEVNLSKIPFNRLNNFNSYLNAICNSLDKIKGFNSNIANAPATRTSLINNITREYNDFHMYTCDILAVGLIYNNDPSEEKSKINRLFKDAKGQIELNKKESDKILKELKDVAENAKSFATKAGVSKHSMVFKEESELHETESKKWIGYTTAILIAIVIFAIALAFIGVRAKETYEIIQFAISKVIVISALFYGLSITNRNYKAHKHNSILNRHRQNALSTFETFVNAANADDQTKNAVLIKTTHSIFSSQQTGYLNTERHNDSDNKIIEIIKNTTTKGE